MITTQSRGGGAWSSRVFWAGATLVSLTLLYFGLRASIGGHESRVAPEPTYDLIIAAPTAGEALRILPAKQDATVTLRIRSGRAGEIHVHGYDQSAILEAGTDIVLTFVAKASGIFPIHLHEHSDPADPNSPILHRQLAVLEVKAE